MRYRLMTGAIIFWGMAAGLLAGCWDIRNPQDINYFTALGFDYVDEQFIVYAQMIDFASISNPANEKPTNVMPVWVGRGRGDTAASAFNDLYESSQMRVFYGHVNAIIFSENMMKYGLQYIFDLSSRYYELRYTPWVFGTIDPIDHLMSLTPFFNLSPMSSLLHQPEDIYMQKSVVPPMMLREFVSDYREPGKTAIMPLLSMNRTDWTSGMKPQSLLDINGLFAFHSGEYVGHFAVNQLMGLRFVRTETDRTPLVVRQDEELYAEISLMNPEVRITPNIRNGKVTFLLEASYQGDIIEILQSLSQEEMEHLASAHVKEEITSTFEKTLAQGVDIYQLEHTLYRTNHQAWRRLAKGRPFQLTEDSLEVKVEVNLMSAGKLKLRAEY